jgi:hypothetical protein
MAPASYTTALTARCQGAYSGRSGTGVVFNFAGDATKLYDLQTTTWTDISGATYGVTSEEMWSFAQYKDRVMATNIVDPVQSFVMGTSSAFADLAAAAPKAKHIAVWAPGFTVLGNTSDGTYGAQSSRIWWSGVGDPTSWPTPATAAAAAAQSGFYDIPTGGSVQAIVGAVGSATGLVFMEKAIYRVQYVGPPQVFDFIEIEKDRGTPSPKSVVHIGSQVLYLSDDGFYMHNGSFSTPIGYQKVDQTFGGEVQKSYRSRIVGAQDPINALVMWIYPTNASSSGAPNRILIYNYNLQKWSQAGGSSSDFSGSITTLEYIYRAYGQGYTLEQMDSISSDIETIPLSLDHPAYAGGAISLGLFCSDHKTYAFSGSNMEAVIETGDFNTEGRRAFVRGFRVISDVSSGTVTGKTGIRETPGGTIQYPSTGSPIDKRWVVPQRLSGRFVRAQVTIPSASSWTHAQGVEPLLKIEGERETTANV